MSNSGNRLIVGILSLGYVFISAFVIFIALSWPESMDLLEPYLLDLNIRWIIGITAALIFLMMFLLFYHSFRAKPIKFTVIHDHDLGQVNITMSALEQLILKSSNNVLGVQEVKPILKLTAEGIFLLLKVQVVPDVNIPQVTTELQQTIKDYLLQTAGTSVQNIKVQVTKISMDAKTTKTSRVE